MNLKNELLSITNALSIAGLDYAFCGGIAVVVHGYARLTRDIDILIQEKDLGPIKNALKPIGYSIETGIIPFDTGKPYARKIFRLTKIEGDDYLTIDLLLMAPFLEDVWNSRERLEVEGVRISIVSVDGLIKMKKIAGRAQDLADISFLEGDKE